MILRFGEYVLDVDTESTRAFYNSKYSLVTSKQCKCDCCQNYDKAIMTAPDAVLDFLREFGIDPQKPGEVYPLGSEEVKYGESCFYGGWYHVVGRIIGRPKEERPAAYKPDPNFPFNVYFGDEKNKMGWVNKKMPNPIFELCIDTHLTCLREEGCRV